MKISFYYILLIFSLVYLVSCENDNELKSDEAELLIGHWISPVYIDTLVQYTRAEALNENDFGISFNPGNSCVERQNAGWCGTPPISYANYNGTWSKTGDIIDISVDFWGGKANHQWKVISIDSKTLTIYPVKSEYIYKESSN
jgi:hypothetical protein